MHDPLQLDWDDVRVFVAVLRAGSFTRAAHALAANQSTVTRRIRALEDALGHSLFERGHDGLTPTPLCGELAAYAERMEADLAALVSAARNSSSEPAGRVRLATTESFAVHVLLPHLLAEFRAAYPRIAIDLVLGDVSADLARREADLALRFYQPSSGDLIAKRILTLPTAVLAHRDYPGARRRKPETLDWIVHALPGGGQSADMALLARIGPIEPALTTTSHLAQVEAVRAGLGVALLARSLTRLAPELIEVPVTLPELPSVPLWLVTPQNLRNVPRIDALWTFLEQRLTAALATRPKKPKTPR